MFIKRENELINFQNEINNSSKIYNQEEIDKKINQYNQQINLFKSDVENFNLFINDNLNYNKDLILKKIANISEIISAQNNIDLIIEAESFFIASESIDISQLIIEELNKNKIFFEILDE